MSDILVVFPPLTADDCILFAKNSDRPPTEVQEIVYFPPADHSDGSKLHCTFLEIAQVSHTHAIVLSKPAWAWGAEMGANEKGVCVGNTAVWTKLCRPGDHEEKLLGADLVRLALERGSSAKEALGVITEQLESHGQGGLCCEDHNFGQWTHHNSFIIADRKEAWLLETADKQWVAKRADSGMLTTTSTLTIGTDADLMSDGLKEHAQSLGLWKPEDGEFNFAKALSADYPGLSLSDSQLPSNRLQSGRDLIQKAAAEEKLKASHIFQILRDQPSSLNFIGELLTVGSQVSVLPPLGSSVPACHWFTGTPNPAVSIFKPFIFCDDVSIGNWTASPSLGDRPRATFQTSVDRRHALYKVHEKGRELMESRTPVGQKLQTTMQGMENQCVHEVNDFLRTFSEGDIDEVKDLFNDIVESEAKFYY